MQATLSTLNNNNLCKWILCKPFFLFFFNPLIANRGKLQHSFTPTQIRFKQWNYKNNKENAVLVTATSRNNLREFCFLFHHLFTMKALTIIL